jgi:hypothetical protein
VFVSLHWKPKLSNWRNRKAVIVHFFQLLPLVLAKMWRGLAGKPLFSGVCIKKWIGIADSAQLFVLRFDSHPFSNCTRRSRRDLERVGLEFFQHQFNGDATPLARSRGDKIAFP